MMKKILLLLILTIFTINLLTAQQSISKNEKLVSLGKIYGFLKYYHPEVGKGNYDWDKEFLKQLPLVLNAADQQSLSIIYIDWIDSLGNVEECKKCDTERDFFDKNFDLSWTQDPTLFNNELISKLKYIELNRIQGYNFYVTKASAGNINVTNEPVYENFDYPSEEYRLLGLFKYWNIIEYFYPYKYLTDQNWNSVLEEMIPKFQSAPNKVEYQSTVKELVAKLDDSHAWVSFKTLNDWKYLPVVVSTVENKPVISSFYNDSLAKVNNLKLGDIILKINDKNLKQEIEKKSKFVSGSNENHKYLLIYLEILSGTESQVTMTIERNNKIEQVKVKRYDFKDFNYLKKNKKVKSKSLNDNIGFINMASDFNKKEIDNMFKSFENKEAIIIDLRNYPNSNYNLFSRHLNSEKRDFAKIYGPNIDYPGKFSFQENLQTLKSNKTFKGKVILLVSEKTLSKSEFIAMAFQTADNVITIGNQTAGADGNVVVFQYIGGYRTAISGKGILYPDSSETQRKGIKIDIEVKPTINGLKQGRDEVLERAIKIATD